MRRLLLVAFALVACKADTWSGFFYPRRGNLTEFVKGGPFQTVEQCRSWVDAKREELDLDRNEIDYECGKNCKPPTSPNAPQVCEDTIR